MTNIACSVCSKNLPLRDFYRHPLGKHGRQNKCKECHRALVKLNRSKKAEYYLEFDRARAFRPDRVAARKAYAERKKKSPSFRRKMEANRKKWIESNPEKKAAQIKVGNAVRDGRLKKPTTCEACGVEPRRLHGHHEDYSKPLSVQWLCISCHGKLHRRFEK
jgi:hypothetical protein